MQPASRYDYHPWIFADVGFHGLHAAHHLLPAVGIDKERTHPDDVLVAAAEEIGRIDGDKNSSPEIVEPSQLGKVLLECAVQYPGQPFALALLVVVERLKGEPVRGWIKAGEESCGHGLVLRGDELRVARRLRGRVCHLTLSSRLRDRGSG